MDSDELGNMIFIRQFVPLDFSCEALPKPSLLLVCATHKRFCQIKPFVPILHIHAQASPVRQMTFAKLFGQRCICSQDLRYA